MINFITNIIINNYLSIFSGVFIGLISSAIFKIISNTKHSMKIFYFIIFLFFISTITVIYNYYEKENYIKIDKNGNKLSINSRDFSCVVDNRYDLVWEIKSSSSTSNLHSPEDTYRWNKHPGINDYEKCFQRQGYKSPCNVIDYLDRVNNSKYCGFDDWRLPTSDELSEYLLNRELSPNNIDSTLYPYNRRGGYWSSDNHNNEARYVDFMTGYVKDGSIDNYKYIRLVRYNK